jgi:actin-like protein 6B
MSKGTIENWNLFEELVEHILTNRLDVEPEFHPILFTEQARAPPAVREKLLEIMMEKFKIPAFYTAKNPVLACYANGRASGIVLDAGATHTTASAGNFICKKTIFKK